MKTTVLLLAWTLLVPVAGHAVPCADFPPDPCALPAEFAHTSVVEESGIRVTFASTQATWAQGDVIELRMMFENVGDAYYCVNDTYMPIDAVYAFADPCADPALCVSEWVWAYPSTLFYAAGVGIGLDPGECRVFSYAWDTAVDPVAPGTVHMLAGVYEFSFDETFGQFRMPSAGVTLEVEILESVPVSSHSSSMLKSRYR